MLKDCRGKVIYETDYGKSDEKDLALAYNQALREAAKSFEKLNYNYNGKIEADVVGVKNGAVLSAKLAAKAESLDLNRSNSIAINSGETFYFAQPISNGYQIVDRQTKVIMKVF